MGFSGAAQVPPRAPLHLGRVRGLAYGEHHYEPDYGANHGAVAGAGVEFGRGRLHVSPEFRYTRWKNKPVSLYGSRGFSIQSNQNQAEILVGITWR